MQNDLAIVIPCYNEANRLSVSKFKNFLSLQTRVSIFFVDEGSKDKTYAIRLGLKNQFPSQIEIYSIIRNGGKANAVFTGFRELLKNLRFDRQP